MSNIKSKIIIAEINKNFKPLFNLIDAIKRTLIYISGGKNELIYESINTLNKELITNIGIILKNISQQNFISCKKIYENQFDLSFPSKISPKIKNNISLNLYVNNITEYFPNDLVIVVSNDISTKNYFRGMVKSFDNNLKILTIYNIYSIIGKDYDSFVSYKIFIDYSYIYNFSIPFISPEIPIYKFNLSYFFKTEYCIIQKNNKNILKENQTDVFNEDIFNIYGPTFLVDKINEFEENLKIIQNMYKAL